MRPNDKTTPPDIFELHQALDGIEEAIQKISSLHADLRARRMLEKRGEFQAALSKTNDDFEASMLASLHSWVSVWKDREDRIRAIFESHLAPAFASEFNPNAPQAPSPKKEQAWVRAIFLGTTPPSFFDAFERRGEHLGWRQEVETSGVATDVTGGAAGRQPRHDPFFLRLYGHLQAIHLSGTLESGGCLAVIQPSWISWKNTMSDALFSLLAHPATAQAMGLPEKPSSSDSSDGSPSADSPYPWEHGLRVCRRIFDEAHAAPKIDAAGDRPPFSSQGASQGFGKIKQWVDRVTMVRRSSRWKSPSLKNQAFFMQHVFLSELAQLEHIETLKFQRDDHPDGMDNGAGLINDKPSAFANVQDVGHAFDYTTAEILCIEGQPCGRRHKGPPVDAAALPNKTHTLPPDDPQSLAASGALLTRAYRQLRNMGSRTLRSEGGLLAELAVLRGVEEVRVFDIKRQRAQRKTKDSVQITPMPIQANSQEQGEPEDTLIVPEQVASAARPQNLWRHP